MRIFLFAMLLLAGFFFAKQQKQERTPSVSIPAVATVLKEIEVKNLDGSKKLILSNDSLFISDEKGRRLLYSGENIVLPQNAWAPDDAYVFIKQGVTFLVFKTSGEQIRNIHELFSKKLPERTLKDVTGWDGVGLIHVTSDKFSYWFDVSSGSFLQLY